MIHIFRGDSANETFGNQITVALETDMDTTDCKCRLTMPYAEKTSFIVNGRAVFTFTTEETAQIPFGEYYASLSLLNGSAKLTIKDDLIVSVTDSVAEASRDNTISVDVVGRFTEALKGVVWDEGSTIKTLREFLSRVGEAMGATVVRLALVSMIPLFAFSQGTIDSDFLVPGLHVVTNAFQNASNDIARLIESTITPSDRITDGSHTLYPSLDYEEIQLVPATWNMEGNILYPEEDNSWTNDWYRLSYRGDSVWRLDWYIREGLYDDQNYPQSETNMFFNIEDTIYHLVKVPAHQEFVPLGKVALKSDVSADIATAKTELEEEIAAATNNLPTSAGITTNDVCNIVTNTVSTGWTFPDVFDGFLYAPSEAWMRAEGDISSSYYIPSNLRRESGKWVVSVMFWDGDGEEFVVNDGYDFESSESANATTIHFGSPYTSEDLVVSRSDNNALGLARLSDLPQSKPVDELLLNGADGKVYHLRIGAGGSIDIYTEVSP